MSVLFHPLDEILSSRSKVRLLRALLPLDDSVSAREAARLASVPSAPALRALADLAAMGILHRTELSSQHLYTVNRQSPLVRDGLTPLFAAERARVGAIFGRLREELRPELSEGVILTLAIYGSAARGEDRPGSDLDVLAVTRDDDPVMPVHDTLTRLAPELDRMFGLDLSPVVVSLDRLRRQCEAGDPVMSAVLEEARVVAGSPLDALWEPPSDEVSRGALG